MWLHIHSLTSVKHQKVNMQHAVYSLYYEPPALWLEMVFIWARGHWFQTRYLIWIYKKHNFSGHLSLWSRKFFMQTACVIDISLIIVRRAGLLWSQQDFEWRWSVPLFKCLIVLEFSFILFDLCLLITFFNFIMNYVPIVTFWIFTYHKIWILSIMFCFIWSYWIIYFLACLEVSWRVVS